MQQAREMIQSATDAAAYNEYAERVDHRLRTREVIDKEDYDRRFRQPRATGAKS